MKIHHEGRRLLRKTALTLLIISLVLYVWTPIAGAVSFTASLGILAFILWFFRNPERSIEEENDQYIYAPADGRVVVVEEVEEPEYFRARRLQVSIFMSITDVHLNRVPISGRVIYQQHHPGGNRVAWHPKASLENERSTTVINNGETDILLRQIAGAVARRIRTYCTEGMQVRQGAELGFIKFGSRMDILLPLDAKIEIQRGRRVTGNKTLIAKLRPARINRDRDIKMERAKV